MTATVVAASAATAIEEAYRDAGRAVRYAVGGVAISVIVNTVHLIQEVSTLGEVFTARGSRITAEALAGPALVFISSHLLMHADRAKKIEEVPLWAGFIAGAALSSVHQWAIAYSVLSEGILSEIVPWLPYAAAGLLPIGVEGASIGSLQQASRFRSEAHTLKAQIREVEAAEAEAAREEAEVHRRQVEAERAEAERLAAQAAADEVTAQIEAERRAQAEAEAAKADAAARREQARLDRVEGSKKDPGRNKRRAQRMRADGKSVADIAAALDVSARTVRRYLDDTTTATTSTDDVSSGASVLSVNGAQS